MLYRHRLSCTHCSRTPPLLEWYKYQRPLRRKCWLGLGRQCRQECCQDWGQRYRRCRQNNTLDSHCRCCWPACSTGLHHSFWSKCPRHLQRRCLGLFGSQYRSRWCQGWRACCRKYRWCSMRDKCCSCCWPACSTHSRHSSLNMCLRHHPRRRHSPRCSRCMLMWSQGWRVRYHRYMKSNTKDRYCMNCSKNCASNEYYKSSNNSLEAQFFEQVPPTPPENTSLAALYPVQVRVESGLACALS